MTDRSERRVKKMTFFMSQFLVVDDKVYTLITKVHFHRER